MKQLNPGETALFHSDVYSQNGTHTGKRFGVIIDESETHYLVFTFSTSKSIAQLFGDSSWNNQLICPKGVGNKDKDSYGSPNLTHWIPKGNLSSGWSDSVTNTWFDYFIEECEKWWGLSFEEIEFPVTNHKK